MLFIGLFKVPLGTVCTEDIDKGLKVLLFLFLSFFLGGGQVSHFFRAVCAPRSKFCFWFAPSPSLTDGSSDANKAVTVVLATTRPQYCDCRSTGGCLLRSSYMSHRYMIYLFACVWSCHVIYP